MPALSITNLQKTYASGTQALKGVSLEVAEGDFFALLGANGAGKTTLINVLVGLVMKTGGQVEVFGVDAGAHPDHSRQLIGVVPQEFNFNIFEKPWDIVVAQAGYYGIPRAEAATRTEKILKDLSLWDKRDAVSRTLSGGMKRRLMIARALVHGPKLLILDEPTAGVDVELRHGMWEYLRALNASGTTILMTTHYLEEVEQLCRNMAIINKGEIVRRDSVKNILLSAETHVYLLTVDHSLPPPRSDAWKVVDENEIEITADAAHGIVDRLQEVQSAGMKVRDVRPASNRLEQLFLGVLKQD